jgi:hypothetical protein
MLEAEGIVFDERGHCDLSLYQWSPAQNRSGAKKKAIGDLKTSRGVAASSGSKPTSGGESTKRVKKTARSSNKAKTARER